MKSIDVTSNGHVINGRQNISAAIGGGVLLFLLLSMSSGLAEPIPADLNQQLREILTRNQFTGSVESTLEQRLGRPIDQAKAQLGRLLFFDKFVGLHEKKDTRFAPSRHRFSSLRFERDDHRSLYQLRIPNR